MLGAGLLWWLKQTSAERENIPALTSLFVALYPEYLQYETGTWNIVNVQSSSGLKNSREGII